MNINRALLILLAILLPLGACSGPGSGEDPGSEPTDELGAVLSHLDELPQGIQNLMEPWTGDLDGMAERRVIRLLTVYGPMIYFLDGPQQRGVVYEAAQSFETLINQRLGQPRLRVIVIIVPVRRDELLPALMEGRGDLVAANLTVTPKRLQQVDFSDPLLEDVREIVVTGPAAAALESLDDLGGQTVHLRRASSYWSSVESLNARLAAEGKPPVSLETAGPHLTDHDLLTMVSSGTLPWTIVDSHKAEFWAGALEGLTLRPDLAVREGGTIAWAFRKESPELQAAVNDFVRKHRKGTRFGNIIYRRYLEETPWSDNPLDGPAGSRARKLMPLFRKYGERYGFDWRLLAAQAYQESKLDHSLKSRAGAVGIMQILPSTATHVGIEDIRDVESNIHAGVKYLRSIEDEYFDDEALEPEQRRLFALAAYNAGPSRIRKLRRQAEAKGFDPDRWFGNVEVLAARHISAEPVRYVRNIARYYVAYRLVVQDEEDPAPAHEGAGAG